MEAPDVAQWGQGHTRSFTNPLISVLQIQQIIGWLASSTLYWILHGSLLSSCCKPAKIGWVRTPRYHVQAVAPAIMSNHTANRTATVRKTMARDIVDEQQSCAYDQLATVKSLRAPATRASLRAPATRASLRAPATRASLRAPATRATLAKKVLNHRSHLHASNTHKQQLQHRVGEGNIDYYWQDACTSAAHACTKSSSEEPATLSQSNSKSMHRAQSQHEVQLACSDGACISSRVSINC